MKSRLSGETHHKYKFKTYLQSQTGWCRWCARRRSRQTDDVALGWPLLSTWRRLRRQLVSWHSAAVNSGSVVCVSRPLLYGEDWGNGVIEAGIRLFTDVAWMTRSSRRWCMCRLLLWGWSWCRKVFLINTMSFLTNGLFLLARGHAPSLYRGHRPRP